MSNEDSLYGDNRAITDDGVAAGWKGRNSKRVWVNPVLWREVCTWAYGRKVLAVRFGYLLMAAITFYAVQSLIYSGIALQRSELEDELVPPWLCGVARFLLSR